MKLALSVVKGSGGSWAEVEEHGTLQSQLAETDKLFLSNKNLEGDSRVALFITETEGEAPKMISCSDRLSKNVRKALAGGAKRRQVLKAMLPLRVISNDKGYFIVPEGVAGESFSVTELAKGEVVALEDLIA